MELIPIHNDFAMVRLMLVLPRFKQIQTRVVHVPKRRQFDQGFGVMNDDIRLRDQIYIADTSIPYRGAVICSPRHLGQRLGRVSLVRSRKTKLQSGQVEGSRTNRRE